LKIMTCGLALSIQIRNGMAWTMIEAIGPQIGAIIEVMYARLLHRKVWEELKEKAVVRYPKKKKRVKRAI